MTMIGAIGLDGFRGFMTVDAATDAEVFREFVAHELVPKLRQGDVVVMDNLNVHKDTDSLKKIRRAKAKVVFLPPYSPEFNPIEKTWAKIKELIRRMNTLTREKFDEAVAHAMKAISIGDIRGWFRHAGYQCNAA